MMKGFLLSTLFLFSALLANAQSNTTVQPGPWQDSNTWSEGTPPLSTDQVFIKHAVTMTGLSDVFVKSIQISNEEGVNASLDVGLNTVLYIDEGLMVESSVFNANADLILSENGIINLTGNANFMRTVFNGFNTSISCQLYESSKFNVGGDFVFDLNSGPSVDVYPEVITAGSSKLTITGLTSVSNNAGRDFVWTTSGTSTVTCKNLLNVNLNGGNSIDLNVDLGATFMVEGDATIKDNSLFDKEIQVDVNGILNFKKDLHVTSTYNDNIMTFNVDGDGSQMYVGRHFNINAGKAQDVQIIMTNQAKFYLGGNMTRVGGFGNLSMSSNSCWIYNGNGVQDIPSSAGSGGDELVFSNIQIMSSADSIVLQGDLEVNNNIILTQGIIKSSESAMLVLNDGATISEGSVTAYVDGPMKKISTTDLTSFQFPLGGEGRYAPLTIEATGSRAATGGEYIAQYYNCPPPWEVDSTPNVLEQVSNEEFWRMSRTQTSGDVNITLHWTDAAEQGITNVSSLVVAAYNPPEAPNAMLAEGWNSLGASNVSENGITGSISNITTCPPPWEVDQFTFGSSDGRNALPINMESFNAKLNGLTVDIEWATNTEYNADHYVVEKSTDGINFHDLTKVTAKADNGEGANYASKDQNPTDGRNYYRLRQVDGDGMFVKTDIVSINYKSTASVSAYPNPFTNRLLLKGKFLEQAETIRILDNTGKVLISRSVEHNNGFLDLEADFMHIDQPGIYHLEIKSKFSKEVLKILKVD